jgi:hypothetical protein
VVALPHSSLPWGKFPAWLRSRPQDRPNLR